MFGTRLNEIIDDDTKEKISSWDYIDVLSDHRLYYKPKERLGDGFNFHCVQWVFIEASYESPWLDPNISVNTIFHGVAYFDGLRHIYFGNKGYLYCLIVDEMIAVLSQLSSLEIKYCRDLD